MTRTELLDKYFVDFLNWCAFAPEGQASDLIFWLDHRSPTEENFWEYMVQVRKEFSMSPDKHELYRLLDEEREIVTDSASGEWAGDLAWRRIDELLDCLNELNALASAVES